MPTGIKIFTLLATCYGGSLQLTQATYLYRYPWLTPQFYSDLKKKNRALLERSYESIEWGLFSPPKPHAFVSL